MSNNDNGSISTKLLGLTVMFILALPVFHYVAEKDLLNAPAKMLHKLETAGYNAAYQISKY